MKLDKHVYHFFCLWPVTLVIMVKQNSVRDESVSDLICTNALVKISVLTQNITLFCTLNDSS